MVMRERRFGVDRLVPRVKWALFSGRDRGQLTDMGSEILLDISSLDLARAACLIGYRRQDSPWELHLTDLDTWAHYQQLHLPGRPILAHWIDRPSHRVGRWCTVRLDGDNWRGIVVADESGPETGVIDPSLLTLESQRIPRLGIRILRGESMGVSWVNMDEVRLGKEITDPL